MNIRNIEFGTVRSQTITEICVSVIKSVAADKLGRADTAYQLWLLWVIDKPALWELPQHLRPGGDDLRLESEISSTSFERVTHYSLKSKRSLIEIICYIERSR